MRTQLCLLTRIILGKRGEEREREESMESQRESEGKRGEERERAKHGEKKGLTVKTSHHPKN